MVLEIPTAGDQTWGLAWTPTQARPHAWEYTLLSWCYPP